MKKLLIVGIILIALVVIAFVFSTEEESLQPGDILPNGDRVVKVNNDGTIQVEQTRHAEVFGSDDVKSPSEDISDTTVCSDNMNWSGDVQIPSNLQTNDNQYVYYGGNSWDNGDTTDGICAYNFGFAVSGTVDGVRVRVINWMNTNTAVYEDMSLFTAVGTRVGDDKEDGTNAVPDADPGTSYTEWGAVDDTWNAGLTAAQVNDSGFGVEICYTAGANNTGMSIDWIEIIVTYTVAVAGEEDPILIIFD